MALYVTKACPEELVGRRVRRILWGDIDDGGEFWVVQLDGGPKLDYGDPDGLTVVVTGMARRPPEKRRGPDERLMRWRPL